MRVEELMTHGVKSCSSSDPLSGPAQIMWESDVGCVPVVDAERHVVGIITDRDIAMAAFLQGRTLREIPVEGVMSKAVQCCRTSDTVESAEAAMRTFRIRRLPVVDVAERLVGIVSLNDIALEAVHERGARKPEVRLTDVASLLAAVSQHRMEPVAIAAA